MDFEPGQTIGDYEILRVLGAGGMGKVYQVRNNISHRVEAMKVLLPDLTSDSDLVDRFLREIRISASLDHPNIAALRTAQRVNNQLVMVMEYVEGSTFDALMHAGQIPIDKAVDYTSQALSALSYAHSRGVTHRDIKPGNIMLTPAGVVKLMDFGIARLATDRKLTKTGMMVGSVYYMSPEQIEGRDLDPRSDIYSLGITLYEIATGKRPFNGDSEYQIMAAHLKGTPQPPREIDQTLPAALNDIIMMALAKDPAQRFQTADAFRGALSTLAPKIGQSAPAMEIKPAPAAAPVAVSAGPKRDRRLVYMVAGSLATLAVIGAAVVELPKYWHADAGVQKTATQVAPAPVTAPFAAPTPTEAQPPIAAANQPVDQVATPKPVETAPQGKPASAGELHTKKTVAMAQLPAASQQRFPPQAMTPPVSAPVQPPLQTPLQTSAPASPPAQPSAPPADSAELSGLNERMMKMAARIGAVTASVETLRRAQAQQGVGLRSDMVAAQQRVNYQMNEAESNLKQSNAAGAKKRLEAAERDLEKLESLLGK
ncbi:MAG: protein kinase [Acidobacteriota bacterium]|nr:protein kinase [Acidobacteriota bacterium]